MMILIKDEIIKLKRLDIDVSYISEQGGRPINEDTVMTEFENDRAFFCVADGLGAHGGGDVASSVAANVAKEGYINLEAINPKMIYNIFQTVDKAVVQQQTDEIKMKTTLACVMCCGNKLYGAHLGDTRIYTLKNNKNLYFTADHSVAYDEVMKNHGTPDDIRVNPNRHILNAALGVGRIRPPEIFKQKLTKKLSVLMCSDGFWEYVNEDEMLNTLKKTTTSHEWLEAMLKYHTEKAHKFNDNYSAICLRIIKKPKEEKNPCNSKE